MNIIKTIFFFLLTLFSINSYCQTVEKTVQAIPSGKIRSVNDHTVVSTPQETEVQQVIPVLDSPRPSKVSTDEEIQNLAFSELSSKEIPADFPLFNSKTMTFKDYEVRVSEYFKKNPDKRKKAVITE